MLQPSGTPSLPGTHAGQLVRAQQQGPIARKPRPVSRTVWATGTWRGRPHSLQYTPRRKGFISDGGGLSASPQARMSSSGSEDSSGGAHSEEMEARVELVPLDRDRDLRVCEAVGALGLLGSSWSAVLLGWPPEELET